MKPSSIFISCALAILVEGGVSLYAQQSREEIQSRQKNKQENKNRSEERERIPPQFTDISYGPSKANRFDLWLAQSDSATPLLMFIHGGGFIRGNKVDYGFDADLL